ncbi:hypothetical protein NC651_026940 [Populus alba x Populus x berolinensis]|nr:hypothetical protein NC651_026940 [Populus alba x Populus x berolinensis]
MYLFPPFQSFSIQFLNIESFIILIVYLRHL